MSTLRSRVIRLASEQPSLRPILLPLLGRVAGKGPVIPKNVKKGDRLDVTFKDEGETTHKTFYVLKVVTPGKELEVEDDNGRKSTFDIDYSVVEVELVEDED